jgi:hypothetical protein
MRNTTSCKYSLPYCQILVLKLVSDSYPAGLGALLVKDIPADPDAYWKWLEQKRREYTEIEESMERNILTISTNDGKYSGLSCTPADEQFPSYTAPGNDL